MSEPLKITNLPNEILEKVLSYLSYDEIAKNREVCKKFNTTCGRLLNRGFLQMEKRHAVILKKVKSLLPRRESERRVHQLARHCDILSAIETRINMLDMTFLKYIDVGACCFIPGKVIDEILRILRLVENTNSPPRTHEVLQELRDISSMAMEYFDEKIAPHLQLKRPGHVPAFAVPGTSSFNTAIPRLVVRDTFRKELSVIQHRTNRHSQVINVLKTFVTKLTTKVRKQNRQISSQAVKIREQNNKIKEQGTHIAELKRHIDEWDLKFADLTAELNRLRDDTSQNTVSPSASQSGIQSSSLRSNSYSPPRIYKSNIKPRVAQVAQRNIEIGSFVDGDRKRKSDTYLRSSVAPIPAKMSRMQLSRNKTEDDNSSSQNLRGVFSSHSDTVLNKLPLFLSSSLEMLIKSPISSLKSRKRKLQ